MIVPSQAEIEDLWIQGKHLEIAKWLPYFHNEKGTTFIENLKQSNLSQLKDKLNLPPITLGADPEFILCDKKNPDQVVMFSSAYTSNKFGISEAEIGADYGLLEFRIPPSTKPSDIVNSVINFHKEFQSRFTELDYIKKEAITYNHQIARIKDELKRRSEGAELPSYGGYHGKETAVWSTNHVTGANGKEITIDETMNISLSAYGTPEFKKYRPDILSAGGHIHIGGTFIKCLSLAQLNKLVQTFDIQILPICKTVETEAAKLRETIYGAPGEYRLKEYGIEYRSPSNAIFWPENAKVLQQVLDIIVLTTKKHLLGENK